jgi:hypothetical protein
MGSLSLDAILQRARSLCLDAGLDPDRAAQDGRPEWLRFIGQARSSLRQDLQTQDPLELLDRAYGDEHARKARIASLAPPRETADPLEKLERLYRDEMHGVSKPASSPAHHADNGEPNWQTGLAGDAVLRPTHVVPEEVDPLEMLRVLEAAAASEFEDNPVSNTETALRELDPLKR